MSKEKPLKLNIDDFITKKQLKTAAAHHLRKPNPCGSIQPAAFTLARNDHTRTSFRQLVDFKCIISRQLPKMPRSYITKLLFDGRHESLLAQTDSAEIMGGVCFRCFEGKDFAEIVFLAVDFTYKDRRVGSQIMNSLKQLMQRRQKRLLLTYADNTAIGFFRKQGFEGVLETPYCQWNGYIKIYLEGTLMECKIFPELSYSRFSAVLRENKNNIIARMRTLPIFQYPSDVLQKISKAKSHNSNSRYRFEAVPGMLGGMWSSAQERALQEQPEFSLILQQLFTVQSLRKLPQAHVFRGIRELPLMVGLTCDLETFASIEKRILSHRSFKSTADVCKKITKMVKAYGQDLPIASHELMLVRQFEKKMAAHLAALMDRRLTIHIDPLYNEKEYRNKKSNTSQAKPVRQTPSS